jgi:hypothetical protein
LKSTIGHGERDESRQALRDIAAFVIWIGVGAGAILGAFRLQYPVLPWILVLFALFCGLMALVRLPVPANDEPFPDEWMLFGAVCLLGVFGVAVSALKWSPRDPTTGLAPELLMIPGLLALGKAIEIIVTLVIKKRRTEATPMTPESGTDLQGPLAAVVPEYARGGRPSPPEPLMQGAPAVGGPRGPRRERAPRSSGQRRHSREVDAEFLEEANEVLAQRQMLRQAFEAHGFVEVEPNVWAPPNWRPPDEEAGR